MLEIDRLRHGFVAPAREPTDVLELVSQVAYGNRGDHAISVEGEPTRANLDAPKIGRIVDNLVSNAVKHTPRGTPITVRLQREGADLLIAVDDDGPGIPEEYKTSVFELLHQLTTSPSCDSSATKRA